MARVVSDFDRQHFDLDPLATTTGLKFYNLPSTFYMTQYRRQAAEIMR